MKECQDVLSAFYCVFALVNVAQQIVPFLKEGRMLFRGNGGHDYEETAHRLYTQQKLVYIRFFT